MAKEMAEKQKIPFQQKSRQQAYFCD